MSSPRYLTALATAVALVVAQTAFAAPPGVEANRLQQQQLEDNLDLNLQQGMAGRPGDMSPADAQQLDQLQLSQRMQQQQLEQQQLVQQRQQEALQRQGIGPNIGQRDALQQQFATDRQLQMQQFNTEQHQLTNTMKPQTLQPPASAGLVPQMSPGLLPQPPGGLRP
ncbi:MAG TPA: hypothetical protein VGO18_31050 [Steroidobacteraceae bacterium]|nr:hypothetical protein [Steroidobacteraceae bacterium]